MYRHPEAPPTIEASGTTAFVLPGGGSIGAVQVGMLRALNAAEIRPDFVVGASVGAINGVHFAAEPTANGITSLADLWRDIGSNDSLPLSLGDSARDLIKSLALGKFSRASQLLGLSNQVFSVRPNALWCALRGQCNHFFDSQRFGEFLTEHLRIRKLEETQLPVYVVVADACTGRAQALSEGDALAALLATSAIPLLFPPVDVSGTKYMDGDVADRTSIDIAVDAGATTIYLLTGSARRIAAPPATALGMAVHTYNLLSTQRLEASISRVDHRAEIIRVPSPDIHSVRPVDFSRTEELINEAAEVTDAWIADHKGTLAA